MKGPEGGEPKQARERGDIFFFESVGLCMLKNLVGEVKRKSMFGKYLGVGVHFLRKR
jgi:hypothetical protein